MTERYDTAAAAHYAAYRPPLHRLILRRALGDDARFGEGLDIGCGTGYSALALAELCERVVGVDPSPAMLERATPHERVRYLPGSGDALPLPDGSADVITFAGSLFYTDTPATHAEAHRVARPGALVVVYDFDLDLEAPLAAVLPPEASLGATAKGPASDAPLAESAYNHRLNLTGRAGFAERLVRHETVPVPMSPSQLAHVLLSDSHRLDRLAAAPALSPTDLHPMLTQTLAAQADTHDVPAKLYYAVYGVEGR
jgi:SAM-dependent methyltransferase